MENYRKILMAMDGSEHSDYAYTWYLKYLRRKDDYLIFVHCAELSQLNLTSFLTKSSEEIKKILWYHEKKTKLLLARLNEHLKREGINGIVLRKDGNPKEMLLNVAKEKDAICIITGGRRWDHRGISFLGSVSKYLIHHSNVPVLVIRKEN